MLFQIKGLARISHLFDEKFARRVFAKTRCALFAKRLIFYALSNTTHKTLDVIHYVQSGFLIKMKIDEKTGLGLFLRAI